MDESNAITCDEAGFLLPNISRLEDETVCSSNDMDYTTSLERELEKQTELLKQKTKELERLLEQKSFEIETITNSIQAAIVRCNFDERFEIIYANDGFFRMTGYTREQFDRECGNSISKIIHPDDVESMNKNFERQLAAGNTTVNVNRIVSRNGVSIWVLAKGMVVKRQDNIPEFRGVLTDITEQKKVEDALRVSEKRYEVAMGFSDITMFEYNVVTKDLILLEKDANMYGVSKVIPNGPETFIRTGIIDPDNAADYREMYRKIHAGEPNAQCYTHTRDANGGIHEFQLNLTNVYDNTGKPMRAIGVRKNVTQLRRLQKEMEYGNIMTLNQLLIYEINLTKDKIISINEKWAREYGVFEAENFTEIKKIMWNTAIEPEFRDSLLREMSKEAIIEAFENGKKLITHDYRKKVSSGEVRWFRKNVNIVKDSITGDISIRSYIVDINDEKIKAQKALNEKRFYENVRLKDAIAYEVNVTKNLAISGCEEWSALFGIEKTDNFGSMVNALVSKAIHVDDRASFANIYSQNKILEAFKDGKTELICEYRRLNKTGGYNWVRCTMHLFEEPLSGDVKGYSYLEDIHALKQKELDLIYLSEHDALTGLLNKATTEKKINDFLSTTNGNVEMHAFFIIDIDYFKSINDNFGHAFGDVVLSQASTKIKELFRDLDFVGRIGGDEFVAFMKNISSKKSATVKAQEICNKLVDQYFKDEIRYKISVSIGIVFYNEHGKNYDELYRNSDTALYTSKVNGRNQFTIYSDNMTEMDSCTNEIESKQHLEVKNVEKNIVEYIFRILYEPADKILALNSALCVIGKSYQVSRVYIFEKNESGKEICNTFEWCNQDITPQIHKLQGLSLNEFIDYTRNFNADHIFYMHDVSRADPAVKNKFLERGVKSLLQFGIVKNGEYHGFIGFDECAYVRAPLKSEITDLRGITSILSVFLLGMRAEEGNSIARSLVLALFNSVDHFAYLCDPQDYSILLSNETLLAKVPAAISGTVCYEILANRSTACVDCPMKSGVENSLAMCSETLNGMNYCPQVDLTATRMPWLEKKSIYLMIGKQG